ncbi:hypothetical protein F4776DRAFT_313929 [Hypoxylon sp. NC0597]|nr:hypothetical protein F4776DRAFT_313929 [Hypoxylon sp. NC0597]
MLQSYLASNRLFFIPDYSNRAILLMRGEEPPRLPIWAYPSDCKWREQVPIFCDRVYQATEGFLRFDIICGDSHSVVPSSILWDRTQPSTRPPENYLQFLHEWEIEELRCVYHYLTHFVMLLFGDIEDTLCRDVRDAAGSPSALPDTSSRHKRLEIIHPIGSVGQTYSRTWGSLTSTSVSVDSALREFYSFDTYFAVMRTLGMWRSCVLVGLCHRP